DPTWRRQRGGGAALRDEPTGGHHHQWHRLRGRPPPEPRDRARLHSDDAGGDAGAAQPLRSLRRGRAPRAVQVDQAVRRGSGPPAARLSAGGPAPALSMATAIALDVNGRPVTVTVDDPQIPLLYALRNELGLNGPSFGCGLAQCGACTVHVDGKAVRSCVTPLSSLTAQQKVVTLEGLGTPQRLHPVQRAFIEEQAVQCGYCINGMIMESAA